MKKVLSVILTLAMLLSTAAFALPVVEFDAVEAVSEAVLAEASNEAALASTVEVGLKPGLNIIGQTADPWTFDGDMSAHPFVIGRADTVGTNIVIKDNPITGGINSSSKALSYDITGAPAYEYPSIELKFPTTLSRPVYVSFKHLAAKSEDYNKDVGRSVWLMQNGANGQTLYSVKNSEVFFSLTEWLSYEGVLTFDAASDFTISTFANKTSNTVGTVSFMYDDILIVPSYKISYMSDSGSDEVYTTRYTLLDDQGGIVTTYTPDETVVPSKLNHEFVGWSTSKNATEPITSVSLANEDVKLYPIWQASASTIDIGVAPGLNVFGQTAEPWSFEGNMANHPFTMGRGDSATTNTLAVKNNPITSGINNSASVLSYDITGNPSNKYPSVELPMPEAFDRPVFVSFKHLVNKSSDYNKTVDTTIWLTQNGADITMVKEANFYSLSGWKQYQGVIDFNFKGNPTSAFVFCSKAENSGVVGTLSFMYDDILIVPSYKISYMTGSDSESVVAKSEYVIVDENNNILTSYTPVEDLIVTKGNMISVGWSTTPDATEPMTSVPLANEDVVLYPVWGEKTPGLLVKSTSPGLNMAGGTTRPWSFEDDMTDSMFSGAGGTMSVVDNPLEGDFSNLSSKVATIRVDVFASGDRYPYLQFELPHPIVSRPIYVSFMYHKQHSLNNSDNSLGGNLWVMKNDTGNIAYDLTSYSGGFKNYDCWKQWGGVVDFSKVNQYNLTKILLEGKAYPSSAALDVMFDNVLFVPSYKITYMANDGVTTEPVATKYEIFDENYNIITYYTPDETVTLEKEGFVLAGWTTDSTSNVPMNSIRLYNEDITLYAVWEEAETVITTEAGTTTELTTNNENAKYVVTEGSTLAPKGGILVKSVEVNGDVDLTNGYIIASDSVVIAGGSGYASFTMNVADLGATDGDYVEISGCDVPVLVKDGAKYVIKTADGISFIKVGETTYKVVDGAVVTPLGYAPVKNNDGLDVKVTGSESTSGVRFKTTVAHSMRNASKAFDGFAVAEYGYVASTGKKLASADKLTLKEVDTGNAVKGVAYLSDGTVDRIFSETDEGIIMAAVIVGVPNTKDAYETDLYIKPYIKLEGGLVIYGNATTATMLDLANSIKATMPADAPYAAFINNIIDVCAG